MYISLNSGSQYKTMLEKTYLTTIDTITKRDKIETVTISSARPIPPIYFRSRYSRVKRPNFRVWVRGEGKYRVARNFCRF